MGEIEATIKELKGKIKDLKKRSETQKHLEGLKERIEKLENEPAGRKGLDSYFDIEKEEVLWPSFQGLFED